MQIKISTTIEESIDTVWNRWARPEHIVNWNFATDEWQCPEASNNLIPNGTFSWRMEAKDGSMGFDFSGKYLKILEHQKIEAELDDGRKWNITFRVNNDNVEIEEVFDADENAPIEMQKQGWQAILENFKAYTESNKS